MKTRTLILIGIVMMSTIPFTTFAVLDRYENYLEQLEYEAQRITNEPKPGDKYYIEPELKAKLEGIEIDLRDKVRELHQGLQSSSYAVNLDHRTKEIEVIVENKELVSKIKEITKQYSDDVSFVITHGKITLVDDFAKTWGGPGNRHPAFWGFDIPKVCTEDMIKHLVKYSSMFDRDVPYAIEDIGHNINVHDFDRCVEELLERNPKGLENQDTVISTWDFRQEPSYVIIPLGAVIEGNTSLIPEEIRVVLGMNNTVTWINEDDTAHAFVSDKGGDESWSTGMMKPGESSSVTFNRTGVFEYYGTPGPWKTGTVIVLEK